MFFIGVDLGRKHDETPIGVFQVVEVSKAGFKKFYQIRLVGLEILKGFKSWEELYAILARLKSRPELSKAPLVVDGNGIGDVVIDRLRSMRFRVLSVLSVGGEFFEENKGQEFKVSKKILIQTLIYSMEVGKLKIADVPYKARIREQFVNYTTKIGRQAETFEARTEAVHDDIVTMIAITNYAISRLYKDVVAKEQRTKRASNYNPLTWRGR